MPLFLTGSSHADQHLFRHIEHSGSHRLGAHRFDFKLRYDLPARAGKPFIPLSSNVVFASLKPVALPDERRPVYEGVLVQRCRWGTAPSQTSFAVNYPPLNFV